MRGPGRLRTASRWRPIWTVSLHRERASSVRTHRLPCARPHAWRCLPVDLLGGTVCAPTKPESHWRMLLGWNWSPLWQSTDTTPQSSGKTTTGLTAIEIASVPTAITNTICMRGYLLAMSGHLILFVWTRTASSSNECALDATHWQPAWRRSTRTPQDGVSLSSPANLPYTIRGEGIHGHIPRTCIQRTGQPARRSKCLMPGSVEERTGSVRRPCSSRCRFIVRTHHTIRHGAGLTRCCCGRKKFQQW